MDRLINPGTESVADFHIFLGKPTPHTFAL
jgi:hypothetical protein